MSTTKKHTYAFGRDKIAHGGAYVMVGNNIREAMLELERRASVRVICGQPITALQVSDYDTRWLSKDEVSGIRS